MENWTKEDQKKWIKQKYKLQRTEPLMAHFLNNLDWFLETLRLNIEFGKSTPKVKIKEIVAWNDTDNTQ